MLFAGWRAKIILELFFWKWDDVKLGIGISFTRSSEKAVTE